MVDTGALLPIIIGMGIITYALRLSLIAMLGRLQLPNLAQRAMRFVPAAVLSAIILPELLRPNASLDAAFGHARLVAGIVAVLIAWRTKNVVLTLGTGMATLWILQVLA